MENWVELADSTQGYMSSKEKNSLGHNMDRLRTATFVKRKIIVLKIIFHGKRKKLQTYFQ